MHEGPDHQVHTEHMNSHRAGVKTRRTPLGPPSGGGNFRRRAPCNVERGAVFKVTQATAYMVPMRERSSSELDAATIESCRASDPAALKAFVIRYERVVFAFLSRTLGAGPHVEDLAQDVFMRAFRALPRFDAAGAAKPSTWLLTIASRLVIDERRRRRVPTQPIDLDSAQPALGTPETERERAELGRALSRAAGELTPEHRDVFVLAEFHGLDMKDIAAVLSINEATVKTRLFRARERLRSLLRGVLEER
jgi:RNA polymerase sigma-70 factor (ECF subfamily)